MASNFTVSRFGLNFDERPAVYPISRTFQSEYAARDYAKRYADIYPYIRDPDFSNIIVRDDLRCAIADYKTTGRHFRMRNYILENDFPELPSYAEALDWFTSIYAIRVDDAGKLIPNIEHFGLIFIAYLFRLSYDRVCLDIVNQPRSNLHAGRKPLLSASALFS